MVFVAILLVLFGLAMIFARDFMWELHVFSNQLAGHTSERTEVWDAGQIFGGAIFVLIGAVLVCWQISESSAQAAENANATATAVTELTRLENAFGAYIPEWQQTERENAYRVSPGDLRVLARSIYYGRCEFNDFYVYVMSFHGQYDHYAYIPESNPEDCAPPGLMVISSEPIGSGWYSVMAYGTPEATRAPRPATPVPDATEE